MLSTRRHVFALAVTALAGTALFAVPQDQGAPTFRSSVTYVEVDVSVLDRDRRPVRGLTAGEFIVLEDGRAQPVETFSEIDVPDPTRPTNDWMRDVAPDVQANITASDGRLVVIVLDDAQVRFDPRMTAAVKDIGRRLVDHLGPSDLASVVYTRDTRNAQGFTQDRGRLTAAVEKFVPGFSAPDPTPRPSGGVLRGGDQSTNYFYQSSVETLERVTEFLASVPQRRKALVYVSVGVPILLTTGFNRADPYGTQDMLRTRTSELFRKAQQANVTVYPIDPSGLGGLDLETNESIGLADVAGGTRAQSAMHDFLRAAAENTGGFAIVNQNEFSDGIDQIFAENGSYYLLGYRSTNPAADGKFRRIEVRVGRPGLVVRARGGYNGPKAGKPANATAPSSLLTGAATGLVPKTDVGMQVTAAAFAVPGSKKGALAIVVGLRQPAPQGADRVTENVDVLVGAYGKDGRRQAGDRLNARLVLRPGAGQVQYEIYTRLEVDPGTYQLRVAAESALEGKSGSVFFDVEMPDFSKEPVSFSGVMITTQPAIAAGGKDRLRTVVPIAPTTQRQFLRQDLVAAYLRVYQGSKAVISTVDVAARIVNDQGNTVYNRSEVVAAERFAAARSAEFEMELPVARLAPGRYVLLTLEATRRAGGRARRDVRFSVR